MFDWISHNMKTKWILVVKGVVEVKKNADPIRCIHFRIAPKYNYNPNTLLK